MRCEKAHTDVDRASGSQGLVQGEDLARVCLELKNPVSVLRGRRRCAEARSTSTGASFVQRWDRQSLSGRREPSVQSRPCVIQQKAAAHTHERDRRATWSGRAYAAL